MDLGPGELAIILVIILVLFGGKKLPELARSLGQAKKEFESAGSDTAAAAPADGAPAAGAADGSPGPGATAPAEKASDAAG